MNLQQTNVTGTTLSRRRRLLFTTVMLVGFLGVLEAGARARAWLRYGTAGPGIADEMIALDPATGLRYPRPGYAIRSNRISISINSLGFRGAEVARQKPPGTVRIVTVGASTTFCAEVSDDTATWPHRLQEALQREYPQVRIEVINAGVPGFVVTESLKNLQQRVLPLDPDLVIFYEANNDMAVDTRELARRTGVIDPSGNYVSEPVKRLSEYSLLFDLLYKNTKILVSRDDTADGKLQSIPKDLPNRFIGELDKMHHELKARDIQFVLSTFLVKYRRGQDRPTQIANASVSFYYMPWMTIDTLLDGMDVYNAAIVRYARSNGIPVVEDNEAIPADDEHYVDWAHMSDKGTERMAERFRRFLTDHKLLDGLVDVQR